MPIEQLSKKDQNDIKLICGNTTAGLIGGGYNFVQDIPLMADSKFFPHYSSLKENDKLLVDRKVQEVVRDGFLLNTDKSEVIRTVMSKREEYSSPENLKTIQENEKQRLSDVKAELGKTK